MPNKIAQLVTQRGKLVLANSGCLCLTLPTPIVRGAFASLSDPGLTLPNNIGRVEVMTASEVKSIGADNIDERGHEFNYKLGPIHDTPGSNGTSKIYYQEVKSNELNKLRKSYGLSEKPKGNKFKLIIATRKTNVLRDNTVSKVEKEPELNINNVEGPAQIMRIRIFRFSKFGEDKDLININYNEAFVKAAQSADPQGNILEALINFARMWIIKSGIHPTNPVERDAQEAQNRINSNLARETAGMSPLDADAEGMLNLLMGLTGLITDPTQHVDDLRQLAEYLKPHFPLIVQLAPEVVSEFIAPRTLFEYHIASVGRLFGEVPPETLQMLSQHVENKYFGPDAKAKAYGLSPGKVGRIISELAKHGQLPLMYLQQNPELGLQVIDQNLDEIMQGVGTLYNHHPNISLNEALDTVYIVNSQRAEGDDTPLGEAVARAILLPQMLAGARGHFGSIAGGKTPEQLQQVEEKLTAGFANSRVAADLSALKRAVLDGATREGSVANQIVQNLREHAWVNLDTTRWSRQHMVDILTSSGVPFNDAHIYVSDIDSNLAMARQSPEILTFGRSAQPQEILRQFRQFSEYNQPSTARLQLNKWLSRRGLPTLGGGLEQLYPGIGKTLETGNAQHLLMGPAYSYAGEVARRSSSGGDARGMGDRISDALKDWEKPLGDRALDFFKLETAPTDYTPARPYTEAISDFTNIQQAAPTIGSKSGFCKYPELKLLTPSSFFRRCGG